MNQVIIFLVFTHRRTDITPTSTLRYKSTAIEQVSTYKYLGLTYDSKLTWIPHYNKVLTDAQHSEAMVKRVVGATWGLTAEIQRWIWTAVTSARVLYGCHVTITGLKYSSVREKLKNLTYGAAKRINRVSTTTPKLLAIGFAGIEPLESSLKRRAVTTQAKMPELNFGELRKGKTWQGHSTYLTPSVQQVTNGLSLDICDPFFAENHFTTHIPPAFVNPNIANEGIQVYTDGSNKGDGQVGSGWAIYVNGSLHSKGMSRRHQLETINQAETAAIQGAAEDVLSLLLRQDHNINQVSFFTDSRVVLSRLGTKPTRIYSTKKLVLILNKISALRPTEISWCAAHTGLEGNELADQLAKSAAMLNPVPQDEETTRISFTVVKAAARFISKELTSNLLDDLKSNLNSTNHLIGYMRDLIDATPTTAIMARSDRGIQQEPTES